MAAAAARAWAAAAAWEVVVAMVATVLAAPPLAVAGDAVEVAVEALGGAME
jgi:hypothetical protein